MSSLPDREPADTAVINPDVIALIEPRARDLGEFSVRRVLPSAAHRLIGPFIFFDHMGPADFPPGGGINVRPHPHINLETVTYLFEGEIMHRDSVGSAQLIRPGEVNWMTAGRGIVHSERTRPEVRATGSRLHGIQLWLALPQAHEEVPPAFAHHPASALPQLQRGGATCRVIAGEAWGVTSPVRTFSPLFYVDADLPTGATLDVPDGHPERAVYVASGVVEVAGTRVREGQMAVLRAGAAVSLRGVEAARLVMLGGAPLDGPRHIWWNFVSSSEERIAQAKADWAAGRYEKVPGDDVEFIPLPTS